MIAVEVLPVRKERGARMDVNRRQQVIRGIRQMFETDGLLGLIEVPIASGSVDAARIRTASRAAAVSVPKPAATSADQAAKAEQLKTLAEGHVLACSKCHLAQTRTKVVFGQGNPGASLVFVGEAPGADEDREGEAFIGRAGQLLTRMIEAMGLSRDDVFICNVLKCRPPDNRAPSTDEIAACSGYLMEQLKIIQPKVIVALGAPASQTLLNTREAIGRLRGRFHEFHPSGQPDGGLAIKLMPTYHPAYLLRSPGEKSKSWSDLKLVMAELGLMVSK